MVIFIIRAHSRQPDVCAIVTVPVISPIIPDIAIIKTDSN
jgi:hypothetical protein